MKAIVLSLIAIGMVSTPLHAGETIFGKEGSGRPTNTIVGALFGAATGAAIGKAAGGRDGVLIGSLVGTAVGGSIGNTIPASSHGHYSSHRGYHVKSSGYKPKYKRSYHSRSYHSSSYRPRIVVVEEKPIVVKEAPIVVVESELAPYGHLQEGTIKSPWSEFTMSVGGLESGQTVYDGLTGKAFRIP